MKVLVLGGYGLTGEALSGFPAFAAVLAILRLMVTRPEIGF
ncbi:hypothetical protein ACFX5Q_31095 [Mesorhizobium sp. IMUNJ 23033]